MTPVSSGGGSAAPSGLLAATPPLVALRDVRVSRGGREILRGVTADIARGKVTGLVGLNGSGKTTLLRAVVGEYPYRGRIEFRCGHDHSRPRPEHVGYVPQRLVIDARLPLTVRDLFALALSRRPLFLGVPRWVSLRAAELLKRVGLPGELDQPVEGLSGGELQRLLLALALEPSPELLLLDEPASGIDFKDQKNFYDLISRLNHESGLTVLMVSHDLGMLRAHSDHVLCLKNGTVLCQGPPDEVLAPANLARTFGSGDLGPRFPPAP
jgi:zinc transport system ATP-binding protein